jgi:predicted nucleotidyltransferase
MIGLIAEHREEIKALCRRYGVLRLDLFGSAATGAFNAETSDLDFIATFSDTEKPGCADRYLGFAEVLEALFGRSVDLLTERSIRNPYFRQTGQGYLPASSGPATLLAFKLPSPCAQGEGLGVRVFPGCG